MGSVEPAKKICFLIGPMRGEAEMERQRRLAKIVREALDKLERSDFEVRIPVISEGGDIVQQVIKELDGADIVVADLTGNNPSVLYELAVRHCMGLPCIHVRDENPETDIPLAFDIRQYRYAAADLNPEASGRETLIEMLKSAIQEAEHPSNQIRDPVTTYFKVPLTDVYPASGLAIGYSKNFVVRTAEGVAAAATERAPIKIRIPDDAKARDEAQAIKWRESLTLTDEEWKEIKWREDSKQLTDEEWDKVNLTIWIPDKIDFVRPRYIDVLKRTREFYDATLYDPKKKFRDIPVLIRLETLQIIDIPTTLRVIEMSVEERLGLSSTEGAKLLTREFDRFGRSLAHWIRESVKSDKTQDRIEKHTEFLETKVIIEPLPYQYRITTVC